MALTLDIVTVVDSLGQGEYYHAQISGDVSAGVDTYSEWIDLSGQNMGSVMCYATTEDTDKTITVSVEATNIVDTDGNPLDASAQEVLSLNGVGQEVITPPTLFTIPARWIRFKVSATGSYSIKIGVEAKKRS